jgi:hypothetical protein
MSEIQQIRFFCEWGGGALWPGGPAADRFAAGPLDDQLPLSPETRRRLEALCDWHDTSLNWEYPPDPGPWRQAECDRFNAAAAALLERLRAELGPLYAVIDAQPRLSEDPDLDAYLADPAGFRRAG